MAMLTAIALLFVLFASSAALVCDEVKFSVNGYVGLQNVGGVS
jgi:hypothetical protein